MFRNNLVGMILDLIWPGLGIGLVFGLVFHEFSHAFAGISYSARVFEMGLMTMYYIVPGAYVMMDANPIKSKLRKLQISAAGIEMNLMLASIFLILGALFWNLGVLFLVAAIQNVVLAFFNLTLLHGLDGMAIVNEFLGAEY